MKTLTKLSFAITVISAISYAGIQTANSGTGFPGTNRRSSTTKTTDDDRSTSPRRSRNERVLAQGTSAGPEAKRGTAADGKSGVEFLQEARSRLQQYKSVRANLTERISIQNHAFTAEGSYLQGKRHQVRVLLSVKLGGNHGSMVEVCDGQILWTRQDVIDQKQVTRRDVQKILEAAEKSGGRIQGMSPTSLVADMGLGGLAGLLSGIAMDMDFAPPREETIDGVPMIILEGKWNQKYLSKWKSDPKDKYAKPQLPPFVPEQVKITLRKENLFPRQISYSRRNTPGENATPLLVLELTKEEFDKPVRDEDFRFDPPADANPIDVTQFYLERLKGEEKQPGAAPANPGPEPPQPAKSATPKG